MKLLTKLEGIKKISESEVLKKVLTMTRAINYYYLKIIKTRKTRKRRKQMAKANSRSYRRDKFVR